MDEENVIQVFLCHSSFDKPFVRRLANELRAAGVHVWLDEWELKVGDSIRLRIEEGIRDSGFLVVALSVNSVRSRWVEREISAALEQELNMQRVFILPVLIEPCDIPMFLRDKKYARFDEDYGAGLNDLLKSIHGHVFGGRMSDQETVESWWWGRWNRETHGSYCEGTLTINAVDRTGYNASFFVLNGVHIGEISGRCSLVEQWVGVLREPAWNEEICEISIRKHLGSGFKVKVEANNASRHFCGLTACFDGTYVKEYEYFLESGFLSTQEADTLILLMGDDYWSFRKIFHSIEQVENLDPIDAQVLRGHIQGLAWSVMGAILMKARNGNLWAAFLEEGILKYCSNNAVFGESMPKTIEDWRKGLSEHKIIKLPDLDKN